MWVRTLYYSPSINNTLTHSTMITLVTIKTQTLDQEPTCGRREPEQTLGLREARRLSENIHWQPPLSKHPRGNIGSQLPQSWCKSSITGMLCTCMAKHQVRRELNFGRKRYCAIKILSLASNRMFLHRKTRWCYGHPIQHLQMSCVDVALLFY